MLEFLNLTELYHQLSSPSQLRWNAARSLQSELVICFQVLYCPWLHVKNVCLKIFSLSYKTLSLTAVIWFSTHVITSKHLVVMRKKQPKSMWPRQYGALIADCMSKMTPGLGNTTARSTEHMLKKTQDSITLLCLLNSILLKDPSPIIGNACH